MFQKRNNLTLLTKFHSYIIKLRSALLVYLTHQMALPILRLVRRPEIFPYSKEQLMAFNQGSLGRDLVQFIELKKLQLLPYYARHDIKHILLDYDTTDDGEVCLQSFMLGNGHVSFPVIATVLYGFLTMPEHWNLFRLAYQRGKQSIPIKNWKWFELLLRPTIELKAQIRPK